MIKKQGGYVSILILLGAIILIGSGIYIYKTKNSTQTNLEQTNNETKQNLNTDDESTFEDPLEDIEIKQDYTDNQEINPVWDSSDSFKIFKGTQNLGFKTPDALAESIEIYYPNGNENISDTEITYSLSFYKEGEFGKQQEFFIHIEEEINNEDSECFIEEWETPVYSKDYLIKGKKFTEIKYKDYDQDRIIIFNTESPGKCLYIDFNLEYVTEDFWREIFEENKEQIIAEEMTEKEFEQMIQENNSMIKELDAIRSQIIKTVDFY